MTETIMEVHVGDAVTFADPHGTRHPAVVTAVWGFNSLEEQQEHYAAIFEKERAAGSKYATDEYYESGQAAPWSAPSVNVVYVDGDETKVDPYGRQIARSTSVVHRSNQAAHGMFWE